MPTAITAPRIGWYLQDKFQLRPNLSISAGLRFDYHGGLTEKNGRIFNFDPSSYSYESASDTIASNGFIVAGNNPLFPTKGVSDSTLTGRQWGLAPASAWLGAQGYFNDKVVVRTGWGMYYDRGELFTYLSPGFCVRRDRGRSIRRESDSAVGKFAGLCRCLRELPRRIRKPLGHDARSSSLGQSRDLVLPNATAISEGAQLFFLRRLQSRQQATLHAQRHARYSMAAAPRPGYRHRLRRQSRPP